MPLYAARVVRHELTDTISLDILPNDATWFPPGWEVVTVVTDVELFAIVED